MKQRRACPVRWIVITVVIQVILDANKSNGQICTYSQALLDIEIQLMKKHFLNYLLIFNSLLFSPMEFYFLYLENKN